MPTLPYRAYTTWLSGSELIVLDRLFDCGVAFRHLRREGFRLQWNLPYSHDLNDRDLWQVLSQLCNRNVLKTEPSRGETYYCMTPFGGELWSRERCPIWERFCGTRGRTTSRDRELWSVVAVSPEIRDDFLRLYPLDPARRRTATITNFDLISWRPFPKLHVGLATYLEEHNWPVDRRDAYREAYRERTARLQQQRSWWRCVPELQRFVPDFPAALDQTPGNR